MTNEPGMMLTESICSVSPVMRKPFMTAIGELLGKSIMKPKGGCTCKEDNM
jgi:hypothetical protein